MHSAVVSRVLAAAHRCRSAFRAPPLAPQPAHTRQLGARTPFPSDPRARISHGARQSSAATAAHLHSFGASGMQSFSTRTCPYITLQQSRCSATACPAVAALACCCPFSDMLAGTALHSSPAQHRSPACSISPPSHAVFRCAAPARRSFGALSATVCASTLQCLR